jgi:CRISPR/Cas system CMR-associated protein Cmr5 small subunit
LDISTLDLSNNKNTAGNIINKLKNRIEELEDLVNEQKERDGVAKTVQLNDTIEELEK